MSDFKVDAELVVRTQAAARGMEALSGRLSTIASSLRGAQGAGMGFMGSMLATNAITAGFGMLTAGIHHATSGLLDLTTQMQSAQIGIATMVAGFQGVTFQQAQGEASDLYRRIQQVALTSTATSSQLQDAFQTMYAGMATAGLDADRQMEMLGGTATAAAAYMGNDLAQTSRDMSMIMSGMAGQQVKLWRPLQHLIGMSAEQWNSMAKAHPERAAQLLREQLASPAMRAAGEAYGRSLAGALSTAEDYIEHFKRSTFTPIANAFGTQLNRLNDWLGAHREQLDRFFGRVGERLGATLTHYAGLAERKLTWVADHWDEIGAKIRTAVGYVRALVPHLVATAKIWLTVRVAMMGAAAAMTAASRAAALAAQVHSAAGFFAEGGRFMGMGLAGAGAAAGAEGAAGGAAAAAGGGSLMASLDVLFAALAPILAPLAAILAAIGSVLVYVSRQWDRLASALAPFMVVLGSVYTDFMTFAEGLWDLLSPVMEIVGALLTFLGVIGGGIFLGVLKLISTLFRALGAAMSWVGEKLQWLASQLSDEFTYAIEAMGRALSELIAWMDTETTRLALKVDKQGRAVTRPAGGPEQTEHQERERRVTNINGARITVNQEFREADPDRVAVRMIEDIARYAEQRIMSGMAPALTR